MILSWEPLNIEGVSAQDHEKILTRLDAELVSWLDTPFMPGQAVKQMGVDCDHFVGSIIDFLCGKKRVHRIPRARQDTALNCVPDSKKIVQTIMGIYDEFLEFPGFCLQPGDVVSTGSANGGEGHVLIAGAKPDEFFHAQGNCVKKSGSKVLTRHYDLMYRSFRSRERHSWAAQS